MFDAEVTKRALFGRIGWRGLGPVTLSDGSVFVLSGENTESRSGRYFPEFHKAVTLQNIYDTMELPNASESDFNNYLKNLQYSAIIKSLGSVFNDDTLIEQSLIFNRRSRRRSYTVNDLNVYAIKNNEVYKAADVDGEPVVWSANLVEKYKRGYRIDVAQNPSYCTVIRNISLLFAESGSISVTLCHSNIGVVKTVTADVTAGIETIVPFNATLYYTSDLYKSGYFYIYHESDLMPVELNISEFNRTHVFKATPFEGNDLNNVSFTNNTYGLNMQICTYRDFTEIIGLNECVFDTLIGLHLAVDVIEQIMNSTRSNKIERITKEQLNDLYNDLNVMFSSPERPYALGLKAQILKEMKRVKENLLPSPGNISITPCFI